MRSKVATVVGAVELVAGLTIAAAPPASAATTLTWTGAGGDANWSTAANWNPAQVPATNDILVFPATAAQKSNTNDLPANTAFDIIEFDGGGYSLGGAPAVVAHVAQISSTAVSNTITLPLTINSAIGNSATSDSVLTFAGPITLPNAGTLVGNNGSIVISGGTSGPGGFSENASGSGPKTVMSGSDTNTAPTAWLGGTLVVNGTHVSSPIFFSGGLLSGTGTAGPVDVQAGQEQLPGVLSAGDPVGTLRTGNLHFNPATPGTVALGVELAGAGPGQADRVQVAGTVTITDGTELVVFPDFTPPIGQKFTIIDNDGTDPVQGTFDGLSENSIFQAGSSFFALTYRGGDGNDVVLTAVNPPPPSILTAPGSGGGPNVRAFGGRSLSFFAPGGGSGGAYVTAGDLDGDGVDEIVVGSGAGVPSQVYIYSADGTLRSSFAPYQNFTGGVSVAIGDVTGDGTPDIITGPGPGTGPIVSVFNQVGGRSAAFFAYDTRFLGGVNVATGDLNGDGVDEIVVGAGSGGGPHVRIFSGSGSPQGLGFFAYDPRFAGGVSVATGDLDGDGASEVITGAGAGGGPHVRTFAGDGTPLGGGFFAYSDRFFGGVTVGSFPDFPRGHDDIVTGVGPGGGPNVKGFLPDGSTLFSVFAYDAGFTGGVRVAGALLNAPQ
ncbi:MAG: VCBS repeat-containing protein [Actinobacteria bacterium]|nr:VCBS repeat-containing protein [Actinomycetota bacterium]